MNLSTLLALETKNLTIQFGGLKAVSDLNLTIPQGIIFGLIGPNGAGKTTVFNLLTGIYQPTFGEIKAFDKSISKIKPYQVTRFGLARTFQNIRLFKDLSVLDNVRIALDNNSKYRPQGMISTLLRSRSMLEQEDKITREAIDLLKIFKLDLRKNNLAKNLPYGNQRCLEIARAMATGAKLLLLDEPAAGMNANETTMLMDTIRLIRDNYKMTILLIEHDMKLVMGICERIAVLDYGVKIAEGTPLEIRNNPCVIEAYLGKGAAHA